MKNVIMRIIYGLKLVALWVTIFFLVISAVDAAREMSVKITTETVTLGDQQFDFYPNERSVFKAELSYGSVNVYTDTSFKEGDEVEVILRNGRFYKTICDEDDARELDTFHRVWSRTSDELRIALIAFIVFGILEIITFKHNRAIWIDHRILVLMAHIIGGISAFIIGVSWWRGNTTQGWDSLGWSLFGLLIMPMCYGILIFIMWIINAIVYGVKHRRISGGASAGAATQEGQDE